jgi:hypothetical protein
MDREGVGEERCEYLWCLHCSRAYRWGEYREIAGLQMCPYEGCDGDTLMDAWTWVAVREGNPDYPERPKMGHVYELNRTPGNIQEEFVRFQQISKHVGGLVPQAQAACILGLSKQRVNDLVTGGRLREHDFFGKNFIAAADLVAFQRLQRRSGRPKKVLTKVRSSGRLL